jgi:hypothetical protein
MTAFRMFAFGLAVSFLVASSVGIAAAQSTKPTTGAGLGSATTVPGSGKRPAAATERLSKPGQATPPSGVTPGGGNTGTVPTTKKK